MEKIRDFEIFPDERVMLERVAVAKKWTPFNSDYARALLAYEDAKKGEALHLYDTAAALCNCKVGTLKSRIHRGRKILLELRKEKSNACV